MRIAVFSDIHGNYQALTSILDHIKKNNIDKIICLGDSIGLGPCSNECMNLINKECDVILAGNHELYYTKGIDVGHVENEEILKHNDWIHKHMNANVNDSMLDYLIEYKNKKLYFTHFFTKEEDYPFESSHIFDTDDYKRVFDKYNYDYVFFGHIHSERIDEYNSNHYYCLESSGCTKDDNTYYYVINLDKEINVEKVTLKYDRNEFEKYLVSAKYPNKDHINEYFFGFKKC